MSGSAFEGNAIHKGQGFRLGLKKNSETPDDVYILQLDEAIGLFRNVPKSPRPIKSLGLITVPLRQMHQDSACH